MTKGLLLLACLLSVGCFLQLCNAQFNPYSLSERQLDDLSYRYGVNNCWSYIKNAVFGGRYSPAKAAALGPALRPTLQRYARSGPCQYELPNSPLRNYL